MTRRVVRCRVEGRVQRVGYRAFVERAAAGRGIVGWVRNGHDDTVELVAAGPEAAIEALIALLKRGPSAARVVSVEVEPAAEAALAEGGEGADAGFVIAPSV